MAAPIFKPMPAPKPVHGLPRATGTALFLHRMQQLFKPQKPGHAHANGHPIIHQPIVVRPARPTHTTTTQLY